VKCFPGVQREVVPENEPAPKDLGQPRRAGSLEPQSGQVGCPPLCRRSPITESGRFRGRPGSPCNSGIASTSASACCESLRFAPVSSIANGIPRPSQIRWRLLPSLAAEAASSFRRRFALVIFFALFVHTDVSPGVCNSLAFVKCARYHFRHVLLACRDPERNVAIIDAFIVGLCILAITPLISLYTLDVGRLYAGHLIWGRSFVRLALAGILYYVRPRGRVGNRWGIFEERTGRAEGRDVA
jgi:hypothetical protein